MSGDASAAGKLVLVGTPLGNRGDLSPRAREAIVGADLLLCEDTRSPVRLLGEGVALPPRISCFVINENDRVGLLLEHLGRTDQAKKVNAAVAFDLSTRDPRGPIRTSDVGDRLAALAGG